VHLYASTVDLRTKSTGDACGRRTQIRLTARHASMDAYHSQYCPRAGSTRCSQLYSAIEVEWVVRMLVPHAAAHPTESGQFRNVSKREIVSGWDSYCTPGDEGPHNPFAGPAATSRHRNSPAGYAREIPARSAMGVDGVLQPLRRNKREASIKAARLNARPAVIWRIPY
jgi:hypothetical protein